MKLAAVLIAAAIAAGAARSPGEVFISTATARGLPRKGLVALWSGDGNARDGAGKNHGKPIGGAGFAPGKVGWAFKLDGKDDCIDFGNPKALQIIGDQTIAMWIKPNRLGVRQHILHKAYGGEGSIILEPTGELNLMYGPTGRDAEPYVLVTSFGQADDHGISRGDIKVYKVKKTAVEAGKWTHIAVVRDLTAGRLRWYVNGSLVVESGTTVPQAKASNAPLRLGAGYLKNFSGLIDEVGIWNRPLTARQIKSVHSHTLALSSVANGLVGLWLGDGNAKDYLGKHHGKGTGTVAYTTGRQGEARGAFLFKGSGGTITIPDHDDLDTDEAFTISLWARQKGPRTDIAHLVIKWGPGQYADYSLEVSRSGHLYLLACRAGAEDRVTAKDPLPLDTWTHVAATFHRGLMKLYINGKLTASHTSDTVKHTCRKEYDGDDVTIGAEGRNGLFDGAMDEVAIFRRALSAEEIGQVAGAHSLAGLLSVTVPYIPRDTLSDRVVLTDGKLLRGAVGNDAYEVTTFFGRVRVPAKAVIGLAPAGARLWLLLADGQVLVGEPGDGTVDLKLPTGSVLKIPLARIRQCGYRITKGRPAEAVASGPTVLLHNGSRLALAARGAPVLHLRTPYAVVPVRPGGLVRIEPVPGAGGSHRAVLAGGSMLTGTLLPETLKLKLALGPAATVRREQVLRLTGSGRPAAPADAAVMVMRNGDRLAGTLDHKVLIVRTEFGQAKVFPISALTMTFDRVKAGAVAIKMWNGGTIEGRLVEGVLSFAIASGGPTVKLRPAHVASITRPYALPGPETLEKVKKLIARLGAESYADRQAATKQLLKLGKSIVPLLKKHLTSGDPEVRQRIEEILEKSDPKKTEPVRPPDVGPRTGPFNLH